MQEQEVFMNIFQTNKKNEKGFLSLGRESFFVSVRMKAETVFIDKKLRKCYNLQVTVQPCASKEIKQL